MIHNNFLQNLNQNKIYLEKLHNRIASGKMVNRPSDDPAVVSRVVTLRNSLAEMEQFDKNIRDASSWLEVSENALGSVNDILQRARELTIYGAGGTLTAEAMGALRDEVEQLIGNLVQVANSTHGDTYVFGGTNTTEPPFKINGDGNVIFVGDHAELKFEVASGVKLAINATDAFGFSNKITDDTEADDDKKEKNIFEILVNLEKLMNDENTDGLSSYIGTIDKAIDRILSERSSLGAKSNRMEAALERSTDTQFEFTKMLSELEDTDYAKAMIDFSVQQAAYHASIKSGAQILQPSLLDFLR